MNWHLWRIRIYLWMQQRVRGSSGRLFSGKHLAGLRAVDEDDQIMDVVDEAPRELPTGASASRRDSTSALRPSAGKAVVPSSGVQTDIAAFLLQFTLPTMDADNITVCLIQDELASIRRRCRTAF